jgi:hypothetical protein
MRPGEPTKARLADQGRGGMVGGRLGLDQSGPMKGKLVTLSFCHQFDFLVLKLYPLFFH